jgi:phage gpG-like protein
MEIMKRTKDGGSSYLFQFVTQRSQRTGYLARSFAFGIRYGNNFATIGPTAFYSPFVNFGTSRGIKANPYLDRILKDAEPQIIKHFNDAGHFVATEITKTS